MSELFEQLKPHLDKSYAYNVALGSLSFDNETIAPKEAIEFTSVAMGILAGEGYRAIINDEVKGLLEQLGTEEEQAKIAEVKKQLSGNFCRRCNYCAPCTVGINIPSVFLFQGYLDRYGLGDWAKDRYASMAVKASACVECGVCETRCPYNLPIREMLKVAAEKFGE